MAKFKDICKIHSKDSLPIARTAWPKWEYYVIGSNEMVTNVKRPLVNQELEKDDWNLVDIADIPPIPPDEKSKIEVPVRDSTVVSTYLVSDDYVDENNLRNIDGLINKLLESLKKDDDSVEFIVETENNGIYIVLREGPFDDKIQVLMRLLEMKGIL